MVLKNVAYSTRPDTVIVTTHGRNALVEIPTDVTERAFDRDGEMVTEYIAGAVYAVSTLAAPNLKARVEKDVQAWITVAQQTDAPTATLSDVVDALNVLTEIVLGGM